MWLKWLGGGIILFTCVAMGRQKAASLRKREKQLQDFIQLSHRIETEISYGQTVLPQIFLESDKFIDAPVGKIAAKTGQRLSEKQGEVLDVIWRRTLEDFKRELYLLPGDMCVAETVGRELGLTYSEEQIKKLQLIRMRLQEQQKAAREERKRMEKVWQALGWCGGGMLVLLFL